MSELFERRGSAGLNGLPVQGSSNLDTGQVEWQDCGASGFRIKPILEDASAGVRTWLMRVNAGAFSPPHSHDQIEQVYVLEGTFYDDERTYRAGEYVVRAAGALHSAGSVDGALVLLFYSPAG